MNSHQRKVESKRVLKEIEAEIITIQSLFLNNDIDSKEFKNLSLSDLKYFRKSLNKVIEELKIKKEIKYRGSEYSSKSELEEIILEGEIENE